MDMKKETRFKIYLQHEETGIITSKDFDYACIFSGAARMAIETEFNRYFIIGKAEYSGLKDKNNRRIYEGDIVKCKTATEPEEKGFICLFKDHRFKFNNINFIDEDFYGTVNYEYISKQTEIIGNIYENHELLN